MNVLPARAERRRAGEQLVQHRAELIDVGQRRDGRAGDLLGRRVLGRQPAMPRMRRRRGTVALDGLEELRQAEVEQLHDAVAP